MGQAGHNTVTAWLYVYQLTILDNSWSGATIESLTWEAACGKKSGSISASEVESSEDSRPSLRGVKS